MIRVTLALAVMLLAVLAGCGEAQKTTLVSNPGEAPYYTDLDEALAACGDDQYVAIKFWADWCHWCHVLDTVTLVDPVAVEFFTNEMILCKIDSEGPDSALADRFHVSGLPTTVMVNKAGEEVDRFIGFDSAEAYVQAFKDFANGIGTLDDLLSKAEGSDDRELMMQIADKYKYRGGLDESVVWFNKVIDAGDPLDTLSAQARLALADGYRRAKDYDKAIDAFKQIAEDFKDGETAEEADFYVAFVHGLKGDTAGAISAYENWLEKYPEADSDDIEYVTSSLESLKNPPAPEE